MFHYNVDIEGLAELLEKNGEFLYDYPTCTYLIRPTLEKLGEITTEIDLDAAAAIKRFASFMEYQVWNSGSSTVSSVLDASTQAEFVKYIAKRMLGFAEVLREGAYEKYLTMEDEWRKEFSSFLEDVRASSVKPRSVKGARLRPIGELKIWERKISELMNQHGLVMKADKPLFLLKSGYRSMYFFNPSHLISRSNVNGLKNQEIMGKFKEILKVFIKHLETELKEKNIAFLLTQKIGGEDPGTSQFAPLFTDLGTPVLFLNANLDVLKGPIIEGEPLLIPFDGVTTTGKTVDNVIDRFKKITGRKPVVYSLIWNRSPHLRRDNVPILSIAPSLTPLPEILQVSINSFDSDLGYWWSSLTMFHDYLKDIYLYAEKNMEEYCRTREQFEKLITDSYEMEEKQSERKTERTAHLFGYLDTNKPSTDMVIYLMNLNILCWNVISKNRFGNESSRLDNSVEYIETMLSIEKSEKPTLTICPLLLRRGLRDNTLFPRIIDSWDKVHRIFVANSENISEYILGNEILRMAPTDPQISKIEQALMTVAIRDLLTDENREELYEIRRSIAQKFEGDKSREGLENLIKLVDKILIKNYEQETKRKLIERVGEKKARELERIKILL